MRRSTLSRSSHAQGGSVRDARARSPRSRLTSGRSISRGRSPKHQSSIRPISPNRRRPVGRSALSNRLSNIRPSGNAMRGGRNRASMIARRRNKRTKWKQNKKRRRRRGGITARNVQGRRNNAARMRMDDYMPPRPSRGHGNHKDIEIDRTVARARREASARTKDIFWTKRLLDAEQTRTNSKPGRRWVHSGFKEMYKEELGYSEAEQSDRMHSTDRRRSDDKGRRETSSLDRGGRSLQSKRNISRSPPRKMRKRQSSHQRSKSPQRKASRNPQQSTLSRLRHHSLSRSPSSSSSISSSSFSNSYSSYSRSSSGSSISGTSSVSSISYQKRMKRSHSPKTIQRSSAPLPQGPKVPSSRKTLMKVVSRGTKLPPKSNPANIHFRRSPEVCPITEHSEIISSTHYDREKIDRGPPDDNSLVQKIVYSKTGHSIGEDTDSDSTSEDEGPRKLTLSERFGKLAQLSSQRQEYAGIRMKIVREGGQDKKVYLEGRTIKSRSISPRKSRSKGAHAKWLREHKAEYDEYEKRYGEFRQWDPHRDLPRELPPNWDDVNVRYRFYKESGYFGDRNIAMEDYLKWEEWWYKYRDWLEKYGENHERESRNEPLTYAASRISSSLWSRDKDSHRRHRY